MTNFKKSELIERVAKDLNVSKTNANKVIETVFSIINDEVVTNEKSFKIPVLGGTMKKVVIKERNARNPRTGEIITVPEKWKVHYSFKPVSKD